MLSDTSVVKKACCVVAAGKIDQLKPAAVYFIAETLLATPVDGFLHY